MLVFERHAGLKLELETGLGGGGLLEAGLGGAIEVVVAQTAGVAMGANEWCVGTDVEWHYNAALTWCGTNVVWHQRGVALTMVCADASTCADVVRALTWYVH